MLAKANYPLSLHLGARSDQKNNKNWLSLSREDDCKAAREKISCAEKLRASKIPKVRPQIKNEEREREREKEKERACNTHHPASHI